MFYITFSCAKMLYKFCKNNNVKLVNILLYHISIYIVIMVFFINKTVLFDSNVIEIIWDFKTENENGECVKATATRP